MRRSDKSSTDRTIRTGEPISRVAHATVDEVKVLAEVAKEDKSNGLMVDVGAHHGSALRHFRPEWSVFAFEPDDENREWLRQRYGDDPNIVIDPRALSDDERDSEPFFTSSVSTGISSLSSFHESHQVAQAVSVTTLARAAEEYSWGPIDVLKIDTEGYDLRVLRGADVARLRPRFIICEFEDRKTLALGYTKEDLATFLKTSGYEVWVSEWHPVIEYGRSHDWRRLARWPCVFDLPDSWGNFICSLDTVDRFDVKFISAIQMRPEDRQSAPTEGKP